jgi:ABC-2 type transport system ATP-binding protein
MLEINDLSKRYRSVVALDGATFSVRPGRLVGFLGPNGAGKTTAMRCIFGLARPDRGTVHWNDRPIDRAARLRFGYMPEQRGLYPRAGFRAIGWAPRPRKPPPISDGNRRIFAAAHQISGR